MASDTGIVCTDEICLAPLIWSLPDSSESSSCTGAFGISIPDARTRGCPSPVKTFGGPSSAANVERDERHVLALRKLGWRAMVVWECELGDIERLTRRITRFLDVTR